MKLNPYKPNVGSGRDPDKPFQVESDPDAPMDQERLLANGRSILRQDVVAADFEIDPQFNLPVPHPAPFVAWTDEVDR